MSLQQNIFFNQLSQVQKTILQQNPSTLKLDDFLFKGKMKDGKLNGKGKIIDKCSKKVLYEGDFQNNKKHGKGKEYLGDIIFEGDFKNNKREGYGKLFYRRGRSFNIYFEGLWKNNERNGNGVEYYLLKSSSTSIPKNFYKGEWKHNKKDGKGKIFSAKGTLIYNGNFKNGLIDPPKISKLEKNSSLKHNIHLYATIVKTPIFLNKNALSYLEKIILHVLSTITQHLLGTKNKNPTVMDIENIMKKIVPKEYIHYVLDGGNRIINNKMYIQNSILQKRLPTSISFTESVITYITGIIEYVLAEIINTVPGHIFTDKYIHFHLFKNKKSISNLMKSFGVPKHL